MSRAALSRPMQKYLSRLGAADVEIHHPQAHHALGDHHERRGLFVYRDTSRRTSIALERRGLARRTGSRAFITPAGRAWLRSFGAIAVFLALLAGCSPDVGSGGAGGADVTTSTAEPEPGACETDADCAPFGATFVCCGPIGRCANGAVVQCPPPPGGGS